MSLFNAIRWVILQIIIIIKGMAINNILVSMSYNPSVILGNYNLLYYAFLKIIIIITNKTIMPFT